MWICCTTYSCTSAAVDKIPTDRQRVDSRSVCDKQHHRPLHMITRTYHLQFSTDLPTSLHFLQLDYRRLYNVTAKRKQWQEIGVITQKLVNRTSKILGGLVPGPSSIDAHGVRVCALCSQCSCAFRQCVWTVCLPCYCRYAVTRRRQSRLTIKVGYILLVVQTVFAN